MKVLRDGNVWERSNEGIVQQIRANVRKLIRESKIDVPHTTVRITKCQTAAWIRRLNLRVYFVESEETFKETVLGPRTSGLFVVDTTTNEYKISAAYIHDGLLDSKYIVVLDRTTSLELIFAVVLGAMNVCGQGPTVFISLDVCDITTQANAARTFPVSQFCTYEAVYPAVLRRLRIKMKPGFHETRMNDCDLRHELMALGFSAEHLHEVSLPPVPDDLYRARWYESELGTLAIAIHRRSNAALDVVAVVFKYWCEDAFHMLRRFLMTQVRENLLLYLQRDGDTGPDETTRTEMLERMRRVKPYRPLFVSGLSFADIHELRHQFPVMAFEGAEVFVYCIDGPVARRLFPRIYERSNDGETDVLFIALLKTYSHVVSYAVCARDDAAMTVVAAKRLINEVWHMMYQFATTPLQAAYGTGTAVPSEHAVARSVLCMSPKGAAFMYEFMRFQVRPSLTKIRSKITSESTESTYILGRPHVLRFDQGLIRDSNCWKRLCGYVGMTPSSLRKGVNIPETHPNAKYVLYSSGLSMPTSTSQNIIVSVFGDVFLKEVYTESRLGGHLYTIDDPNYVLVKPAFDFTANDAWFDTLVDHINVSYGVRDMDFDSKMYAKRDQVKAAGRMAALFNPVSVSTLVSGKPATVRF
jgi:hypothetical protein